MVIYKLQNNLNDRIYIGQTLNFKDRIRHHINGCNIESLKHLPLYRDIKQYGWGVFDFDIIETCNSSDELNEREIYWINYYNSFIDFGGYNVKIGDIGGRHSHYTKTRISKSQIGELNHMYGRKGMNNPSSKRVINLTDNIIYDSATLCANSEGLSISKICAVCRGDRATTGNKQFAYLDENDKVTIINTKKKKARPVINMTTGELYNSATEAEIYISGKKSGNISKCCNGKSNTAYGYDWKYID